MTAVSMEKCLLNLPHKFELSVLAMNRAKEILLNENSTDIKTTRFTKKCVNKSLKEIEEGKVNIDVLEDRIKADLTINNMFLKENANDINTTDSEDDYDSVEINDDIDEIDEEVDDEISLGDIDIDDVEEDK